MAPGSGIDASSPTPRVNFQLLSQHIGKTVRLVGKVEGVSGNDLQLRAADDGIVTVHLKGAAPADTYVEFDGVVESPNSVNEISSTSFGDSFDMSNYNEIVNLMNGEYKSLFV